MSSISAISSSALPGAQGQGSDVQQLEAEEQSVQKQITALNKETDLDAETKAAELTQLEAELEQIQAAIEQAEAQTAARKVNAKSAEQDPNETQSATAAGAVNKKLPPGATVSPAPVAAPATRARARGCRGATVATAATAAMEGTAKTASTVDAAVT